MNRKYILTAVGLILSFAIAIGGWVLTSSLIGINSDRLLSTSWSVTTNTLDNESVDTTPTDPPVSNNPSNENDISNVSNNDVILERPSLTESEMVSILLNWDSVGHETPHEPAREQLNMEQAIETSREWLSFIGNLNIFPNELLYFTHIRAYLFQNLPQVGQFLPPAYSYWTVIFSNESMSISMMLNAVTGQVWDTEINLFRDDIGISGFEVTNTLSKFVLALGISQEEHIILAGNEDTSFQVWVGEVDAVGILRESEVLWELYAFADGNANATVIATSWRLEDSERILRSLRIRLAV